MQIDLEYMAKLCSVFLESDTAMVGLKEFDLAGIEVGSPILNDSFLFHVQLMLDSCLISDINGDNSGLATIGILLNGDGSYRSQNKKFRLTQKGHDFSKSLTNKEILNKLATELKDAPFKLIFDGGQKLLEHYVKKKLDQLLAVE
ncbi:DUF2513 domain-containing protein [Photobacterium damselae subsp. damselae]|uniref:DUF2513 domain-containing protein n=1 Tax=Photobacterium damselae TaxID=38293 RepID=UPI000D04A83B|nr:DUF2513 domain-containing protein [Photobacterium damselae]PSB83146.1 DUF2513 domain-containing protein [Photobacterium damselae subsp. damselae]UKA30307.1 DUF2513 domain-containing protein [Photobacterium damselae subsp. damselae]